MTSSVMLNINGESGHSFVTLDFRTKSFKNCQQVWFCSFCIYFYLQKHLSTLKTFFFIFKSFFKVMITCWIVSNLFCIWCMWFFFSFILKYFYWFVNVTPDLLSTTKAMQSLNVIFSMDYFIWLTNMLLLFRFLIYAHEKSQTRFSHSTEFSIASFACTCFLWGYPFSAFLSGEIEPFSSMVFVAPRAFFCGRPRHCHTRLRRNRMPVFVARRYPPTLLKLNGVVTHPLGPQSHNKLEILLFIFDSYCTFSLY